MENLAKKIHPKTSFLAPWQYWLGITKPKSAFSTILKASNKLLQNLKKIIQWNFLLTNCLIPSGKCNLITAKAMGMIFSLFDVASSRDVPFGILQYIQCTHHGLTFVLLSEVSIRGSTIHGFPTVRLYMGTVRIFRGDWSDCRDDSNTVLRL